MFNLVYECCALVFIADSLPQLGTLWAARYGKCQLTGASAIRISFMSRAAWMGMVWGLDQQPQISGHLADASVIL